LDQSLDQLVFKARDLRPAHGAADHPIGQAGLIRLIDDAAVPAEVWFASRDESIERYEGKALTEGLKKDRRKK
jgi:hypothetical protein